MLPSVGPRRIAEQDLSQRLDALAEIVRIGRLRESAAGAAVSDEAGQPDGTAVTGFSKTLLDDSEALLKRAGERLRLSANHTVVALGGGTGSGKSTLFNALSGANFSAPGVTRPTTRHVHACVWGMQGAAPLLDWLGIQRRHRYARASVLDSGEVDLDGLLLLDLPDHDSVVTASMVTVDRLAKLADMMIWVLDPQKYADAAVHNRYLIPLAGHASVFTVVLNQIDLLPEEQVKDCVDDLRRLLDAEGLIDTPVLPVSARTGEGLDDLRELLTETVAMSNAATDRIAADIDAVIGGFAPHYGPQVAPESALATGAGVAPLAAPLAEDDEAARQQSRPPWDLDESEQPAPVISRPPWEDATPVGGRRDTVDPVASVPAEPAETLADALAKAAGLTAVAEALANSREAVATKLTGWPLRQLARYRHDPVRVLRASRAGVELATGQAQQSEVDNAITEFADSIGGPLPAPWGTSLREAARCNAGMVPQALADSVHLAATKRKPKVPGWWRLVAAWQWLLTVLAVVGVAWAVAIGVGHATGRSSGLLGDLSLVPWLVIIAAAMLLLGYLTAAGCKNMVLVAADKEREAAEQAMHERVVAVTRDLVLDPTGREITQYERFRRELAIAAAAPAS
jgi:GTP-binding protein EngB required for normal cell division